MDQLSESSKNDFGELPRFEKYDAQTPSSRMVRLYGVLDDLSLEIDKNDSSGFSIASIGIGCDSGGMDPWYQQSYEPYILAGWAKKMFGGNFELTLIDPIRRAISSVENGKYVYIDCRSLEKDGGLLTSWNRFQGDMNKTAERVQTNDGTLITLEPYESTTDVNYLISEGMERIPIPDWFLKIKGDGRIKLLNQDIRDVNTITGEEKDLIFCLNVLLHYPEGDQRDILERLSKILKPNGLLVLNDGRPDLDYQFATSFRKPFFKENGGWLNEGELNDKFGMNIQKKVEGNVYILKRNS